MNEKIGVVAFYIFIIGLLSMILGSIYEHLFTLLNDIHDLYFIIMRASLYDKTILFVASITMISFIIFILSFSSNEKSKVKNDRR